MSDSLLETSGKNYSEFTGQLSTVARSLSLAAIAIAWLFGGGLSGAGASPDQILQTITATKWLFPTLWLAVVAVLFDLLHYTWASAAWGIYHWTLNEILTNDDHGGDPNRPIRFAWWMAGRFGIDQLVTSSTGESELVATQPAQGLSALAVQARSKLLHQAQFPDLQAALEQDLSPKFINRTSGILFWIKVVALLGSFSAFLLYVLGVP